jgi:Domain of unknown function (DUF4410)
MVSSMIPNRVIVFASAISITGILALPAASVAQNGAEKVLVGDTKVTMIQTYSGKDKLSKPPQVVVYDFDVPPDVITIDDSRAARIFDEGPIARRRGDAGQESDPEAVAAKVQSAFSKKLVKALKKTSIPTSSDSSIAAANPPVGALIVRGDFTAVNQGNATRRIMVGFGRGASDVKAHVIVSQVTHDKPIVLAEFNLDSQSGKKPGAAATMGVSSAAGSVAAAGGTDKKATVEGDTSRMAQVVAKEVENIMVAQQWIAPTTKQNQPQQASAKQ